VAPLLRPATPADGPALQAIERRAGAAFRTVGLELVADDEPPPLDVLATYAAAGRAFVAVDAGGAPLGYVLLDVVDGCAHVEQVSVDPEHQGQGVGRALLDRAAAWGREAGRTAVTLTTFADVPWNRPLYEHLGFRVLDEAEVGPGLGAVRTGESAQGLDPARRVCMRLDLGAVDRTGPPRA